MSLKGIVRFIKASAGIQDRKIVNSRLLGKELTTIKGTIRDDPDYDDAWFYHLAVHSKIIFDIGANIGYTAILGALAGERKQILLADPNPQALSDAAKNLLLNDLANDCRFFVGFVSDKEGEKVKFFTVGSGAAGSMFRTHAKTAGSLNKFFWVKTTTVDELAKYYHLSPDLIKVDVEGAEALVLLGSRSVASNKTARFLVEMHSSQELTMKENATKVVAWCEENGYRAWYMKEASELKTIDQIAHRGKCHLLLQPLGWPYPDFLQHVKQSAGLPQ